MEIVVSILIQALALFIHEYMIRKNIFWPSACMIFVLIAVKIYYHRFPLLDEPYYIHAGCATFLLGWLSAGLLYRWKKRWDSRRDKEV